MEFFYFLLHLALFSVAVVGQGNQTSNVDLDIRYPIPLAAFRESGFLDSWADENKFVDRLLTGPEESEPDSRERTAYSTATFLDEAGCVPYNQAVEIPNDDPSTFFEPQCVSLPRCGGCCRSPVQECVHTEKEIINFQVRVIVYHGDVGRFSVRKDPGDIQMDIHTQCECQCKIKETDCDPIMHDYDEPNCLCVCKNETRCPDNQIWSTSTCRCQCIELVDCGDAVYQFNTDSCRCEFADTSLPQIGVPDVTTGSNSNPTADACSSIRCRRGRTAQLKRGKCSCVRSYPGRK